MLAQTRDEQLANIEPAPPDPGIKPGGIRDRALGGERWSK
jgi:hypothetical protein